MTTRPDLPAVPGTPLAAPIRTWVQEALGAGAIIQSGRALAGATSSELYLLQLEGGQASREVVLRLFTNREWLVDEPDLAEHEASSLRNAAQAVIPTPRLLACDPMGERCGVPAILMSRLSGAVVVTPQDLDGWLNGLAEAIYPIHQITPIGHPWRYAPYNDPARLHPPVWSSVPELWEQAIQIVNGPWPECPASFVHRDYHPTNVLWDGGTVTGIVDWPNACWGPVGIDLAWCRRNLIHLAGLEAAARFLRAYEKIAGPGYSHDPFWDLMALTEVLPGPPRGYEPWVTFGARGLTPRLLVERLDQFLASVLARL